MSARCRLSCSRFVRTTLLTIRTLILKNPPAHHRLSASREAVRSTIQEMIDRDLQNVLDALVDSFRQSKSADDKDYAVDNFRQDVLKVVGSANTLAYKAWTVLSTAQQRQLIQQILPDVRAKLCDEQAAQFAPSLVDKSWIPTEQDLCALALEPGQTRTAFRLAGRRSAPAQGKCARGNLGVLARRGRRSTQGHPSGAQRPAENC